MRKKRTSLYAFRKYLFFLIVLSLKELNCNYKHDGIPLTGLKLENNPKFLQENK